MTHDGIIGHCGGLGERLGTAIIRIVLYSRFKYAIRLEEDGLTDEQIDQCRAVIDSSQKQLYYMLHCITGDEIQYTPADHEDIPKAGDPDIVALCEQGEDEQ